MSIVKSNKLIADFIGQDTAEQFGMPMHTTHGTDNKEFLEPLKYHESWDWLMPVVEKIINKTGIFPSDQIIKNQEIKSKSLIFDALHTVQIKHVYKAVIWFIEWYNKNKKS